MKVECKEGSTDPVDPEEPEESPLAEDGWTVEADGNADLVEGDFSGWEIIDDKLNSIKGKWMDMENIIIAKDCLLMLIISHYNLFWTLTFLFTMY